MSLLTCRSPHQPTHHTTLRTKRSTRIGLHSSPVLYKMQVVTKNNMNALINNRVMQQRPRHSLAVTKATSPENITTARSIPTTPELQVTQAATAIETAWREDGIKRQRIELLLPLIGATDLDDWPGGIRQQFKAAAPLVEGILKQLKAKEGLTGPLDVEIWDQGDAVGAWFGEKLAAVLFPTGDTLQQLRQLEERPNPPELLLIVNPQWELQGNLVNEFGFGARKEAALQLIDSFKPTYWLQQSRVAGDELRVLRAYPGKWQVHVVRRDGSNQLLSSFDSKPSYAELEAVLKSWPEAAANKSLMDRIRDEVQFIQDTAQQPSNQQLKE